MLRRPISDASRLAAPVVVLAATLSFALGSAAPAAAESPDCGAPVPTIAGGGFESPATPADAVTLVPTPDAQLVWENTAESQVEVWHEVVAGVAAYEGSQFVELDATVEGTLYQDLPTIPGAAMVLSFAHKARLLDGETVTALAGAPGGPLVPIGAYAASVSGPDANGWTLHAGTYTVPAGQGVTRLAFRSDPTTTAAPATGNFLDAVEFTAAVGACDDAAEVPTGGSVQVDVLTNDIGAGLVVAGAGPVAPAGAGTASSTDDQVSFASTAGFSGTATIPYTVTDAAGGASDAVVVVTVRPTMLPDLFSVLEGTSSDLDVLANDLGTAKSLVAVGSPLNGSATIVGDQVHYIPASGFVGPDLFTYQPSVDGAPGPITVQVRVNVLAAANLGITVAPPSSLTPTQPAEWTIVVANGGPSASTGAAVEVPLPPELAFTGATSTGGVTCAAPSPPGTAVACVLPTLAPLADVTIQLTTTVAAGTTGSVDLTATVGGGTPDPDLSDNSATATAAVPEIDPGPTDPDPDPADPGPAPGDAGEPGSRPPTDSAPPAVLGPATVVTRVPGTDDSAAAVRSASATSTPTAGSRELASTGVAPAPLVVLAAGLVLVGLGCRWRRPRSVTSRGWTGNHQK